MITGIDDVNGLDALIHQGEDGLFNHTPYAIAMAATGAQLVKAAASTVSLQGISLANMIGLSSVVYGDTSTGRNARARGRGDLFAGTLNCVQIRSNGCLGGGLAAPASVLQL